MKIVSLTAENFKRLKAVEIHPDGHTVVIKGNNAQGKSSVLDAIMAALSGSKGSKEIVRPIRDGESKARVAIELDDLVVERRWTPSGSSLVVSPKGSNAKLNSPQAVLDKLIGSLSFDPLAFAESDAKSQVEMLIDLIGRDAFDEIAQKRRAAYEERTEVNRDLKRAKARYDAVADASNPVESVSVADLAGELEVAQRRTRLAEEWARLKARMDEIVAEGQALPASRPVDELASLLANAEEINESARRHQEWVERGREVHDYEHASDVLTNEIRDLDEARADLISKAPLPVDGLTFDEDGVSFNGVPFVQSSAAERLKVSVGMAMALNPELRVICIRDASLLDDDSKRALVAMAQEHDYQIWYEVVGKGGDIGVIIEDGKVEA